MNCSKNSSVVSMTDDERRLITDIAKAQLSILDCQMKLLALLPPETASPMSRAIGRTQGNLEYSIQKMETK